MPNAFFKIDKPANEPINAYGPGSAEKLRLKAKIAELKSEQVDIPLIIGGREIRTGQTAQCVCPHDHQHVLGQYHKAGPDQVAEAIEAAMSARQEWAGMDWHDRLAVFLKAADLLAGPYRDLLNASTMLSQSKNVFQAEIDSACEMVDFFRFNCYFATQIFAQQPDSAPGIWNRSQYRPLEGFVLAVTPFNFTSIAGNLPTAPAMVGNVALWKPASSAVYSSYFLMKLLIEAGMPPGVINFVPGQGSAVGPIALDSEHLAGIHFTGSTGVFQSMWKTVGENIKKYRSYPRIVGETGGKDFVFAHESSDPKQVATALVRGAFEYQGQKCSAASRAYIPDTLWEGVR